MIAAVSQSQSVQQRQSKNQKSHFPTILAPVKPLIPARKHPDRGVQKFSWRLNERIIVCPSPGKRRRAVKLHSTKPMATAQVVERLGYPTKQCPGTLVSIGPPACWPYGETRHPTGDENEGDRADIGQHATKAYC